jgi:glycosyltransferase involved in cell wall biosynthesis
MIATETDFPLPTRAYVVSQFPEFCETFILNEIVELEKRGIPFRVFSLKRCLDTQFQPGAREPMRTATHYAPPLWSPRLWWAHLLAALTRPAAYFSTLLLALGSARGSWEVFAKTLYVFAQAPWFARVARRQGLRHVHAHWASIPSSAGLFIARLAGTPFSITAHAYDIFIDRTLLREKIRQARYIVTCTRYNGRFLEETFPDDAPGKVEVVHHGVDLDVFDQPHDPAAEGPLLLSIGRLCDTKGFPDLVAACAILKRRGLKFRCRIIGDGYMRGELESQIRASGLEDTVEITGLLPREKVLDEYRRARLFALPCVVTPRGDRDGLPNVIVEAMAMGLAVVGTNVSALGEAIEDGETGRLVPPRNPQALADAIGDLWEESDLRARMGEKGREKARREFSMRKNVDKLAAFIRQKDEITAETHTHKEG